MNRGNNRNSQTFFPVEFDPFAGINPFSIGRTTNFGNLNETEGENNTNNRNTTNNAYLTNFTNTNTGGLGAPAGIGQQTGGINLNQFQNWGTNTTNMLMAQLKQTQNTLNIAPQYDPFATATTTTGMGQPIDINQPYTNYTQPQQQGTLGKPTIDMTNTILNRNNILTTHNQQQQQPQHKKKRKKKRIKTKVEEEDEEEEEEEEEDDETSGKKKGRRVTKQACVHCRKAHACCSENRPCERCVRNNLECIDIAGKKRGRKKKKSTKQAEPPMKKRKINYAQHVHTKQQEKRNALYGQSVQMVPNVLSRLVGGPATTNEIEDRQQQLLKNNKWQTETTKEELHATDFGEDPMTDAIKRVEEEIKSKEEVLTGGAATSQVSMGNGKNILVAPEVQEALKKDPANKGSALNFMKFLTGAFPESMRGALTKMPSEAAREAYTRPMHESNKDRSNDEEWQQLLDQNMRLWRVVIRRRDEVKLLCALNESMRIRLQYYTQKMVNYLPKDVLNDTESDKFALTQTYNEFSKLIQNQTEMDTSELGIMICFPTGRIISVNKTLTEVLGYESGDLYGAIARWEDVVHPLYYATVVNNICKILRGPHQRTRAFREDNCGCRSSNGDHIPAKMFMALCGGQTSYITVFSITYFFFDEEVRQAAAARATKKKQHNVPAESNYSVSKSNEK